MKTKLKLFAICYLLSAISFHALAQGTAFTYQGRLNTNGAPYSGSAEFQFTLWDAASAGNAVATNNPASLIANVDNGLFTVSLDFGSSPFDGNNRWLEIAVRSGASVGDYTNVAPRQPITATPYAIRSALYSGQVASSQLVGTILPGNIATGSITAVMLASNAVSNLSAPDGSPGSAVQVDGEGRVGIGTSNPAAGLQVTSSRTILSPTLITEFVDGANGYTNLAGICAVAISTNLVAIAAHDDSAVTLVDIGGLPVVSLLSSVRDGTGSFTNLGGAIGVALSGNLLAVAANNDNAVTLINVSNPSNPLVMATLRDGVGGFNELGGARAVNLTSNVLAVAATGDGAVTLVDVSNPAVPVLRSVIKDGQFGFNDLSGACSLARAGNLLAVAALNDSAVTLVNVANPANPVLQSVLKDGVGPYTNLAGACGVAFSGNLLAIVSYADKSVTLVNTLDPTSPQFLASVSPRVGANTPVIGDTASTVAFQGSTLWVAPQWTDIVTAYDVSNPAAPIVAAELQNNMVGFNHLEGASFVAASGANVLLGGQSSATLLDGLSVSQAGMVVENRVGIGVSLPAAALHVRGDVLVQDANRFEVSATHIELGSGTIASGINACAMGQETLASGAYSTAMGFNTTASGFASTAMGESTTASSFGTTAMGNGTTASGSYSTAMGLNSTAAGNYSLAAGLQAKALHQGSFVWADGQFADFSSSANNQFLIRASGGVGIGTSSPTRELEIQHSGDTEVGIKSTDAGGHLWTLQSSSVSGSVNLDGSFQIIDRTSGGARLTIGTNGNVGVGTTSPQAKLHVAGSAVVQGLTTPTASAATNLLNLGSGATADGFRNGISFFEGGSAPAMNFGYDGFGGAGFNALRIYNGSDGAALCTFQQNGNVGIGTNTPAQKLHVIGNILASGTITGSSDRNVKENFAAVDARQVLAQVASLPIQRWNYIGETTPHVGPMAQDFYGAFHVGMDDKHISMVDADGVALAAIQGLNQKLEQTRAENAALHHELSEIRQLLIRLSEGNN